MNITFNLLENSTGVVRKGGIKVEDGINEPVFYIYQKSKNIALLNFTDSDNSILMNEIIIGKP